MDAAQNLPEYARRDRSQTGAGSGAESQPPPNPYIGPTAFQAGQRLYGRDRELNQLTNLLVAERIVLMHSPSGAGKTSLIQAALIPRLETMRFRVLPVARVNLEFPNANGAANRYTLSALMSLQQGLAEADQVPIERLAQMRLAEYLAWREEQGGKTGVEVIVFDQFEQVLSLDPTDRDAKQDFFQQLGEAFAEPTRWVLFSMRDDYVGALLPYEVWVPSQLHNRFRLDLLGHEAARQAIQRPAFEAGVRFLDEAANKLVDDLRRVRVQRADGQLEAQLGPYVEPVQLQVVCQRLWEDPRPDPRTITVQDLVDFGEVDQSLVDFSLEAYYGERVRSAADQTGASERSIREWFERRLITEQGVRGSVLMEAQTSGGLDNHAVRLLENAYLVRAEKRGGLTWIELAHDRLVGPVRKDNSEWFQAHLNQLQQQANLWNKMGRPENLLMTGDRLDDAARWAETGGAEVLPYEVEFIHASRKQETRARALRRRNQAILLLAVVAVALAVLSMLAYRQAAIQRGIAEDQAAFALANQYAAQSQAEQRVSPLRSLLLAVEAVNATAQEGLPRQPGAEQALRAALREPHGRLLPGPGGAVRAVAFSPDGRWLAVGSQDGAAYLWPAGSFQAAERVPLTGHSAAVNALAFRADGRLLATGSRDGTVRLWDLSGGIPAGQVAVLSGPRAEITTLAISPDGKWLAAGSLDQSTWLWSLEPGAAAPLELPSSGLVLALAFSPDGRLLAGGSGPDIALWQMNESGASAQPQTLAGHQELVSSLAFSPDGRWLASGSRDKTARLWDLNTRGADPRSITLEGHENWVNTLAFLPDSSRLATGSADKTVRLWDLTAGEPGANPLVLRGHTELVNRLVVSQDGRWLASGSADHTARLWDLRSPDPAASPLVLNGHDGQVLALAFSPDGSWLATGSEDRTARLWTVEGTDFTTDPVMLGQAGEPVTTLAYSPDGAWLAVGSGDPAQGSQPNAVRLWKMSANRVEPLPPLGGYSGWVSALAFDPRGRWLASGGGSDAVRLWDLQSADPSAQPRLLEGHSTWVWSLAFSPDGSRLACGDEGGVIRVWNLDAPGAQPLLFQAAERVTAIRYSADGRWLAASSGFAVYLWDLRQAEFPAQPIRLAGHQEIVTALAFHPDGTWLATGGRDQRAYLWDLEANDPGARPVALDGHSDWINTLRFSPEGHWLATAGADGAAMLWDMDAIGPFMKPVVLSGHERAIRDLAFSPDGKQMATASDDRTIRLWPLDLSVPIQSSVELTGHERAVTTLAFSPDGSWLASGGADHSVRLWITRLDRLLETACRTAGRGFTPEEQRLFFAGKPVPRPCPETP